MSSSSTPSTPRFVPAELDVLLAMATALDLPALVRMPEPSAAPIQAALDGGATGILVPHVDSATASADVVRWSHYGRRGRGYSGSTRAAGWGRRPIADVLAAAAEETVVVVQVEDASALDHLDELVAVPGIDAVFVGAADLTVSLDHDDVNDPTVQGAIDAIVIATRGAGVALAAYAADGAEAARWRSRGVTLMCEGSDQARLLG